MSTPRRSLVTGGAGFIGSHLADQLLERGDQVLLLDDLSTGRLSNIEHLQGNSEAEFVLGSILNADLVDHVVGVLGIGVGQELIAPFHELLGMVVGDPQKPTQHAHRKQTGHLGHEVELAVDERFIKDPGCELPD